MAASEAGDSPGILSRVWESPAFVKPEIATQILITLIARRAARMFPLRNKRHIQSRQKNAGFPSISPSASHLARGQE